MGTVEPVSTYAAYLPAILRQGAFLGRFLRAFEAIFAGGVDPAVEGLEETLDRVHESFDPEATPAEFLGWLSQWAATSLRDDWSEATKRRFLGEIVPLYQKRGTRAGIEAVLRHCTTAAVEVRPGDDTKPRHYFEVVLTVAQRDPDELARMVRQVRAIVDREKPAHTIYGLRILYPAMRIANTRTPDEPGIVVGETTVLGTVSATLAQPKQP